MDPTRLDSLRILLQEAGASDEEIEETIDSLGEGETATPAQRETLSDDMLRVQLMNEPDWRKRAALAALLASRNL